MNQPTHTNADDVHYNVLGTKLVSCCFTPLTGYYRDGFCRTDVDDRGLHTVCAVMTDEFLQFSAELGNDLMTPMPEYGFDGLKPDDYWCLCALRWCEALDSGIAPPVKLEACHESLLKIVDIEVLKKYAL